MDTSIYLPENRKTMQILELTAQKKDPFSAGSLSLLYAGAGQFYNGDFTKGSLFFLGETVYHIFNFAIRFKMQSTYGASAGFSSLETTDQVLLVSSFILYLGIKAFSIYDAYDSSVQINRGIDENIQRIMMSGDSGGISVTLFELRF